MAAFTQEDIGKIYETYVDQIYRFFYYKFLSKDIAEDLTSKTMIRFIEKVKQEEAVRDPGSYIFGIAKFIYLEKLKEKYQLETTEYEERLDSVEAIDVEDFVDQRDTKKTLEDIALPFIDQLPEKQQLVIKFRLIEKMTIAQVCEKLDVDSRYVRTTQNRAINKLKEMISKA